MFKLLEAAEVLVAEHVKHLILLLVEQAEAEAHLFLQL
jgi:hypothetical protein